MAAAPYTHDGRVRIRDLLTSSNKVYRPIAPADTSGQWSFGVGDSLSTGFSLGLFSMVQRHATFLSKLIFTQHAHPTLGR